ncbi:MAG: DUF4345 domain-containing protein [Pseudomonadota bacterium]
MGSIIVLLSGVFFLVYGAAFGIAPNAMSELVTGARLADGAALIDFRATYGGLTLAVGLMILLLYRSSQIRLALLMVISVLACMAFTRVLGMIVDGGANTTMYVYLALESGGALLGWFAMHRRADQ